MARLSENTDTHQVKVFEDLVSENSDVHRVKVFKKSDPLKHIYSPSEDV